MSGVCTPLVNGMSIITESGKGISVHFNPGERWNFKQNKAHENMLTVTKIRRFAFRFQPLRHIKKRCQRKKETRERKALKNKWADEKKLGKDNHKV